MGYEDGTRVAVSCGARASAESAVDLMETKPSEAERQSRGEARLAAARHRRALDSLSASEKDVSMRSTARRFVARRTICTSLAMR